MIEVVAAIIEDAWKRILLAQRPPGKHLAGLWEFPGGKIEVGESAEAALHRELHEELALKVSITRDLGRFIYHYPERAIALHTFVVRAESPPSTTEDVHAFRWLAAGDVQEHELAPADVEPWRAYLKSR